MRATNKTQFHIDYKVLNGGPEGYAYELNMRDLEDPNFSYETHRGAVPGRTKSEAELYVARLVEAMARAFNVSGVCTWAEIVSYGTRVD